MGWRFLYLFGVTATLCVGGPLVFAQSPEPIDPPDPKRLVVAARPVLRHEFIVYDPVAIGLGSVRPLPEAITLPGQRRVALKVRLESTYVALPVRMRTVLSARMDSIDIAVPGPRAIATAAEKEDLPPPPVPDQRAIGIALHITAAELEMPAVRRYGVDIRRLQPEVVLITEPLAMGATIQRHRAPVFVRRRE